MDGETAPVAGVDTDMGAAGTGGADATPAGDGATDGRAKLPMGGGPNPAGGPRGETAPGTVGTAS